MSAATAQTTRRLPMTVGWTVLFGAGDSLFTSKVFAAIEGIPRRRPPEGGDGGRLVELSSEDTTQPGWQKEEHTLANSADVRTREGVLLD